MIELCAHNNYIGAFGLAGNECVHNATSHTAVASITKESDYVWGCSAHNLSYFFLPNREKKTHKMRIIKGEKTTTPTPPPRACKCPEKNKTERHIKR